MVCPKNPHFIGQMLRLLSLLTLMTNIHFFYKVLFIILADWFDCGLLRIFGIVRDCKDPQYQIVDKILDLLSYYVLLSYSFAKKELGDENFVLLGLLLYRTLGVYQFFKSPDDRSSLIRFPDFFREAVLYFSFIKYLNLNVNYYVHVIVLGLIILGKYQLEKVIHEYKDTNFWDGAAHFITG